MTVGLAEPVARGVEGVHWYHHQTGRVTVLRSYPKITSSTNADRLVTGLPVRGGYICREFPRVFSKRVALYGK